MLKLCRHEKIVAHLYLDKFIMVSSLDGKCWIFGIAIRHQEC